jgi:hypothetical protein
LINDQKETKMPMDEGEKARLTKKIIRLWCVTLSWGMAAGSVLGFVVGFLWGSYDG